MTRLIKTAMVLFLMCFIPQPIAPPFVYFPLNYPIQKAYAESLNTRPTEAKINADRVMPIENPNIGQKQMIFMIESKNSVFDLLKRNIYTADPMVRRRTLLRAESVILERPVMRANAKGSE